MIGQALVLLAGVLTAGLVASLVGPPIFHDHLLQSGHTENSPELAHIEEAYRDASALSLGIALFIALLCAFAVTWLLTRLLRRPLDQLTDAARELSRGHYDRRVPTMGTVTELDALARAFNSMAQRLETVEDTRRRLLSDLAHELRTPIATLTAYHEGIFDGVTELTGDVRDVLTEQTQRLTHLADDITDVSTAEEGRLTLDRQPHTVAELIAAATDSAREHYAAKRSTCSSMLPAARACTSTSTGNASARCSPTCSATPCGIPNREAPCPSRPNRMATRSPSPSRTPAKA